MWRSRVAERDDKRRDGRQINQREKPRWRRTAGGRGSGEGLEAEQGPKPFVSVHRGGVQGDKACGEEHGAGWGAAPGLITGLALLPGGAGDLSQVSPPPGAPAVSRYVPATARPAVQLGGERLQVAGP